MFPKNPVLICRSEKCLNEIIVNDIDIENFRYTKGFACPDCGRQSRQRFNKTDRFFKFYPRLLDACEKLKKSGFTFSGYTVAKSNMDTFYMAGLNISCNNCKNSIDIPVGMINDVIADANMVGCHFCRTGPSGKTRVKKFFINLKNVHHAMVYNLDFQWDIFRPIQMDPILMRPRDWFYYEGR